MSLLITSIPGLTAYSSSTLALAGTDQSTTLNTYLSTNNGSAGNPLTIVIPANTWVRVDYIKLPQQPYIEFVLNSEYSYVFGTANSYNRGFIRGSGSGVSDSNVSSWIHNQPDGSTSCLSTRKLSHLVLANGILFDGNGSTWAHDSTVNGWTAGILLVGLTLDSTSFIGGRLQNSTTFNYFFVNVGGDSSFYNSGGVLFSGELTGNGIFNGDGIHMNACSCIRAKKVYCTNFKDDIWACNCAEPTGVEAGDSHDQNYFSPIWMREADSSDWQGGDNVDLEATDFTVVNSSFGWRRYGFGDGVTDGRVRSTSLIRCHIRRWKFINHTRHASTNADIYYGYVGIDCGLPGSFFNNSFCRFVDCQTEDIDIQYGTNPAGLITALKLVEGTNPIHVRFQGNCYYKNITVSGPGIINSIIQVAAIVLSGSTLTIDNVYDLGVDRTSANTTSCLSENFIQLTARGVGKWIINRVVGVKNSGHINATQPITIVTTDQVFTAPKVLATDVSITNCYIDGYVSLIGTMLSKDTELGSLTSLNSSGNVFNSTTSQRAYWIPPFTETGTGNYSLSGLGSVSILKSYNFVGTGTVDGDLIQFQDGGTGVTAPVLAKSSNGLTGSGSLNAGVYVASDSGQIKPYTHITVQLDAINHSASGAYILPNVNSTGSKFLGTFIQAEPINDVGYVVDSYAGSHTNNIGRDTTTNNINIDSISDITGAWAGYHVPALNTYFASKTPISYTGDYSSNTLFGAGFYTLSPAKVLSMSADSSAYSSITTISSVTIPTVPAIVKTNVQLNSIVSGTGDSSNTVWKSVNYTLISDTTNQASVDRWSGVISGVTVPGTIVVKSQSIIDPTKSSTITLLFSTLSIPNVGGRNFGPGGLGVGER